MRNYIQRASIQLVVILFCLSTVILAGDWRSGTPLNTPRWGASAVVLDGYIYVLGGATTGGMLLNTVERYDPDTQTWDDTIISPFSIPRVNAAAIVYNGKIYLMGGRNSQNEEIDEVEVYDPVSGSWTMVSELEKKREGHVAFLVNGTICVMGGLREGQYVDEIEWYDATHDEWHKTSMDMPNPVAAPFYTSHNDSLYLFGGFYTAPIATGQLAEVDSGWGFNWYSAPSLQTARGFGASATLGDTLFMIGGTTLSGATDLVEIFHLDTQLLETFTPAPTARVGMTAVALDHSIYVIGGYTQDTNIPTNLVEIYSNITDISQIPPNIPLTFAQIEGYPNPFNGAITLEVLLPVRTEVEISIYNLLGERISGLYQGALGSGKHTFRWDGKNDQGSHVSSGIYIAVLKSKDYLRSFRMVYIK